MRKGLVVICILLILLIVGLCGCSEQQTETEQELKIDYFYTWPIWVTPGETVYLKWGVSGADTVFIDNGIGYVGPQGNITISPINSTVYTLTASDGVNTSPV